MSNVMRPHPDDPVDDIEGLLDGLASLAEDGLSRRESLREIIYQPTIERLTTPASRRSPSRDDELMVNVGYADPVLEPADATAFYPAAPKTLADMRISEGEIEAIVLRSLMFNGTATGMELSQRICGPFPVIEKVLNSLRAQRLVVIKNVGTLTDFLYEITDAGLYRAQHFATTCTYCGAIPVSLEDYAASVTVQSLNSVKPKVDDLRRAFSDLTISNQMFCRLGRAISAGRGLFLHGLPGNGKTSIAERIADVYGTSIWIPRAISVWGEIVRVFDPSCHEEIPLAVGERIVDDEKIDHRWVRIRRPTIVVGGELLMANLDITLNRETGVAEAPIQLKSNCGTLVIDDFGRQRVAPRELLNRWIVPLEKRYDYLGLASGRKICVPFDQFIVFSTNLEPKDLVDEAFLRRIPYKIEIENPSPVQFRSVFEETCQRQGIAFDAATFDHLIVKHYKAAGRSMRFCHPRDLLHQVGIYCRLLRIPPVMSIPAIDAAAVDYFSVMGL